ncbi:peptidase [Advenella sp. S44]|uniref:peptidoglycan DD-metalloendopeptidase family protein n=1 Tax=Advenella sp. S44 TaxID=1982755 RepID=UPI000C2AC0A7|nr:peptidoglycan DD-metalloendopeptidase family protein [Advenella sp. S44]PJX23873.1 peptidase [Advenella sp. S44]
MKRKFPVLVGSLVLAATLAGCGTSSRAPVSELGSASRAPAGPGEYIVKRGDTLYKISRANNVSVSQLMSMNNLSSPSLEVGQRLRVSSTASASPTATDSSVAGSATPSAAGSGSAATPAPASDATSVSWGWPVGSSKILTAFSSSTRGIDIEGKLGDPVSAAAAGTVSYVGNGLRGLGNLILISHSNGFISAYAHNSKLLVKNGQKVTKGQKIAEVGQSDTSSPRLHFEIRRRGQPVNPLSYLPRR